MSPTVDEHVEKEDALVRAICNIFDSESESEDSAPSPSASRPAKKRRCTEVGSSSQLPMSCTAYRC